jgi:hypothetical protein
MSYWAACYNEFTAQQGIRMRATIANTSFLNNSLAQLNYSLITNFISINLTGPIKLTAKNEITFGSTGTAIVSLGGSGEKILNAGERIRLQPGTKIIPSSEKIKLSINPFCD